MKIASTTHSRSAPYMSSARAPKEQELEFPGDTVELARNNRPVLLLHGTLVEKEGIAAYRDFALRQGHPVDHRTFPSITKGEPIEHSANLASRSINEARAEIARRNLERLAGAESPILESFFALDADLYGAHDPAADAAKSLLPQLLEQVRGLLEQPQEQILQGLSGQLAAVQADLQQKLQEAGVAEGKARKMAAELVDSVAPKAIVVGHSAGGYVGYALTVNAETTPDEDPFTYDGGNGVAEMLVLSSPIGKGLPVPAPPGILDMGFYNVDAKLLRPVESLPASQLALMNPFFNLGYQSLKAMSKQAFHAANLVGIGLANPLMHLIRPSNAQVEEGSEFFTRYLDGIINLNFLFLPDL